MTSILDCCTIQAMMLINDSLSMDASQGREGRIECSGHVNNLDLLNLSKFTGGTCFTHCIQDIDHDIHHKAHEDMIAYRR